MSVQDTQPAHQVVDPGGPPVEGLTSVTPGLSPSMRRLAPVATGAFTALATLGIMWWNPGDTGFPLCPSKFLLGIDCPFCGATRATAALARGHLGRAFDHNALWTAMVPFVVAWFMVWVFVAFTDRPMPKVSLPRWVWVSVLVALVAFGVARNLDVSPLTRWLGADSVSI